ncbi:MAG: ATP-binding domain-containing protein [Lachnospiraceae bacterium]|nr:ATP-binding domain-containing protein [Lachnospiraceae bacterium]
MNLQEEKEHLQTGLKSLQAAAEKLLEKVEHYSENYRDSARYIWENQSEFDEYEAIFNKLLVDQVVDSGEQTKEKLHQIIKMMDSPYFARIDFLMDGDTDPMQIYIGKFSFWDDAGEFEVFDWRAPISGMYYEYEYGNAHYDAPMGRIEGELVCKRQYKISRGVLEYALESGVGISDEILQQELAKNTDTKMKDIVVTIQREQNQLIRDSSSDILIIHGVAGSGKTSIALHRIAYFLYQYKGKLTSKNFLIISPNGVFVDYIADVLPELGEENVNCIAMDDIAGKILGKEYHCERMDLQSEQYLQREADTDWKKRNQFKNSVEFLRLLDDYLLKCNKENFHAEDYSYGSGFVEAAYLQKCYNIREGLPVRERFQEIAALISGDIREVHKNDLFEWLMSRFENNNVMQLYRHFYVYLEKTDYICYEDGMEIESADIFPLVYIKLYLEGFTREPEIMHLVIDEMQDYSPVQYAVIDKLYNCRKTILGDFCQNVVPFVENHSDFLKDIYPKAQYMEIYKSYRSTYEIMNYAGKIKKNQNLKPIERHGRKPMEIGFEKRSDEEAYLVSEIKRAQADKKMGKLGIICKSQPQAEALFLALSSVNDVHLFTYDTDVFYDGIIVTSVSLSKGLEFDTVLIVDADQRNYCTEYDRNLLYVACTRAMHQLKLLYCGEKSRFLVQ